MSADNENEYQAELQQDLDAEEAKIPEMTPAQNWNKIMELARTIEEAAKDLQDFASKPAFTFDENGKIIL